MAAWFLHYEYALASAQLVLAMLGMGATLRPKDFADVLWFPRGALAGLGLQLVALPLLALALGRAFGLAPGLATGLILVAAVPGGAFSNVLTWLARGHVPLSITLTAVTTAAALVTTPLLLRLLAGDHLPRAFAMPAGAIAREIALSLLAPLAAGMLIGQRLPAWRDAIARWAIRASLVVVAVIAAGGVAAERIDPARHGAPVFGVLLAFATLAFAAGFALCGVLGCDSRQRMAVAIEGAFRNTNLALLLKASLFPATPGTPDPLGDAVFFAILLYAALSLPVVLPPVFWHRWATADRAPRGSGRGG